MIEIYPSPSIKPINIDKKLYGILSASRFSSSVSSLALRKALLFTEPIIGKILE